MFLNRPLSSASLFLVFFVAFTWCAITSEAKAQDCQGKVRHDLEIKPYGRQGDVYHYKKGEIISDVRAHRASFFGKPSYYLSQGIGPLPAKEIELLNCHPILHPSEGFFDPGYDLVPDNWQQQKTEPKFEYRKPVPLEK